MKTNKIILSLLLALLCPVILRAGDYVIINQVMYDTPLAEEAGMQGCFDGEFFELYNGGIEKVSLQNWSIHSLSGKSTREVYTIPDVTIPAGGYLIFASRYEQGDNFAMLDFYQISVRKLPTIRYYSNLILSNKKETLLLINAQKDTVDRVVFGSQTNLKASNSQGTLGNDCYSIHRTGLELDEQGKIAPSKSQWKTDKVSFSESLLSNPMFGTQTVFSFKPSTSSATSAKDNNYILSVMPLDETGKINVTSNGISVDRDIRTNTAIQYYDALGRPNELIAVGITPTKKDLVSTITYSGLHRATEQYLPMPMDTKGTYTDIATAQQEAKSYFGDNRPFTESLYENSALERVIGQKRPGTSYESHPSSCSYSTNTETNIRIYTVNGDKLKVDGNYAAHSLYKTTTKDEDGKGEVITFTDKLGRKIMEERSGSRTYYVYDDLSRLRFVIPNLQSGKLTSGEFDLSNSTLKNTAYCYQYDARGNMIYKRLPGCEQQYMVYDMMGQLILKQDGNQRIKKQWLLYSYDNLGRNTYTAEITMQADWQNLVAKFANEWQVGDKALSVLGLSKSATPMLMENFYDNYDFSEADELKFTDGYKVPYANTTGLLTGTRVYNLSEDGYTTTVYHNPTTSGSTSTTYLNQSEIGYTTTAYYYDAQGRVVQSRSRRSPDNYETITSTKYNFDGSVAETKTIQGSGTDQVTEHYKYSYDHAGRAKEVRYKFNNNEEILLSEFSYDEQGRLVRNLLYKKGEGNNYSDSIKYSYDMRNMLTSTRSKDFSESLSYADNLPTIGGTKATACYNGNIAASAVSQSYRTLLSACDYDSQNRLLNMTYGGSMGTGKESFVYDEAGNILSLTRLNSGQPMDNLSYYYGNEGNRLLSIQDRGRDADRQNCIEYHDYSANPNEMLYDYNGNLLKDPDRSIWKMEYNILNLPTYIEFMNGERIFNYYDAAGQKYKSITLSIPQTIGHPSPSVLNHLFDVDSVDYHEVAYNGNVEVHSKRIGKVTTTSTTIHNSTGYNKDGIYYHFVKDHLGSNCVVVKSATGEVVQSTAYYASGVPMPSNFMNDDRGVQPYLYNGKEFVETPSNEYNVYDYGFRGYYATIGRFTSMDPLCEKYYHISPYAYCANNPIIYIDPDGCAWYLPNGYPAPNTVNAQKRSGEQLPLQWTDCKSQEEMDKAGIEGVYYGESVVIFNGYKDEHFGTVNGKGKYLGGDDAKLADVTLYGPNGPDDITTGLRGFTMTSDYDKYGAIDDGIYWGNYDEKGKSGEIPSNWTLNNRGWIPQYDYQPNLSPFAGPMKETMYKDGIFIHSTVKPNNQVGNRTSVGCLMLDWNSMQIFNKKMSGVRRFSVQVKRK